MKVGKMQRLFKSGRSVLLGASLFVMTMASGPLLAKVTAAKAVMSTAKEKTCATIEDQIDAAQAVEDYAQGRYDAYESGSDYSACSYAADAYEGACKAKISLEDLNRHLCDSTGTFSVCVTTMCDQSH